MIEWNRRRLKELVRKMGVQQVSWWKGFPIHLSLYGPPLDVQPLLTKIMRLDADQWSALGYDETDRVSVTRYLGSLGCCRDDALWVAVEYQQPLSLELAKALIDAGAFDKEALSWATQYQSPLTLELAKLLVDAGCNPADCNPAEQDDSGWDALVWLAVSGHPADPQVTDLFLSAGCRTNLDGCSYITTKLRDCFDRILKEHAEWKESLGRMAAENSPASTFYSPDWNR